LELTPDNLQKLYETENLKKEYTLGEGPEYTKNLKTTAGYCDYVFVASVSSYTSVIYDEVPDVTVVYTRYRLSVKETLKGNLQAGQAVSATIRGGVAKNQKSMQLPVGVSMPKKGGTYLFCGIVNANGTMYVSYAVALCELPGTNYSVSENYKAYLEAVRNQDIPNPDRQRYEFKNAAE
jgi:hypothetical protein